MNRIPPYLKKGDTIGITCPAGYMEAKKVEKCIKTLQDWGFEVMVGKTVGSKSKNYFSGSDEERRDELQAMLDDSSIKAILCGRGGYGVSRIIDELDFKKLRKTPKWIIGFSDITVLHAHINRNVGITTLHASMANAFNDPLQADYVDMIRKVLKGHGMMYKLKGNKVNKKGKAIGELIGGNLSLIVHLLGTDSAYKTKGKILFIEDLGEYLYHIDRMLLQLQRAGVLKNLAGLIIGGFTDLKDNPRVFGETVAEMVLRLTEEYHFPICFGFPVSHGAENVPLKVGATVALEVGKRVTLKEM
ncbi:MAG: LD-carboxypeptidase [Chitinophagaceae bacterium]|nr:LD-carboxypeptidase [Chitinophagaceae bacterium]